MATTYSLEDQTYHADESNESGMRLPHSKTLSRRIERLSFREVLECGCPLLLSHLEQQLHY